MAPNIVLIADNERNIICVACRNKKHKNEGHSNTAKYKISTILSFPTRNLFSDKINYGAEHKNTQKNKKKPGAANTEIHKKLRRNTTNLENNILTVMLPIITKEIYWGIIIFEKQQNLSHRSS